MEQKYQVSEDAMKSLPAQLLKQLAAYKKHSKKDLVTAIISDNGGAASLDQIIVGIYERTQRIEVRGTIKAYLNDLVGTSHLCKIEDAVYGLAKH